MNESLPSRRLVAAGLLSALALTACSSTKSDSTSESGSDGKERYARAQKNLETTAGYHVKLTGKNVPSDGSNLEGGEGDVVTKPMSFQGKVTVNTSGNQLSADVISIEDTSWANMGNLMPTYMKVDTADMGVPRPSQLFSATRGIAALPAACKELKKASEKLVDGEKVTMYTGTLDAATATKTLGFGTPSGNYTIDVGLNAKDQLKTLTVTGAFFDAGSGSYTVTYSNYGQHKTISKP